MLNISSQINTALQEAIATVVRLLLLSANIIATISPTKADIILSVAYKTAGKVMAVSTA